MQRCIQDDRSSRLLKNAVVAFSTLATCGIRPAKCRFPRHFEIASVRWRSRVEFFNGLLGENRADNRPTHIGETEVAALPAVGEALVLDAEKMERGGVEIVDFDDAFNGVV